MICAFDGDDGAPNYKAKVIMKWLGDHYTDILAPWTGNSLDLESHREHVANPQKASGQTEVHKL